MTCPHCGNDNPAGKKFCGDCGAAQENRCPQCGADNPANKKFCGDCGAALVASPARMADKAEARKVVTIVFADLIGSTSLHERLDAESTRRLMDRYYRALRAAVESHGGTVV
jgi:predicted amidophosphoribosyltransferase